MSIIFEHNRNTSKIDTLPFSNGYGQHVHACHICSMMCICSTCVRIPFDVRLRFVRIRIRMTHVHTQSCRQIRQTCAYSIVCAYFSWYYYYYYCNANCSRCGLRRRMTPISMYETVWMTKLIQIFSRKDAGRYVLDCVSHCATATAANIDWADAMLTLTGVDIKEDGLCTIRSITVSLNQSASFLLSVRWHWECAQKRIHDFYWVINPASIILWMFYNMLPIWL